MITILSLILTTLAFTTFHSLTTTNVNFTKRQITHHHPTTVVTTTKRKMNQNGDTVNLSPSQNEKRIIFVRHGRTYMNEYLSQPGCRWGDAGFIDIGLSDELYRDSPLSPKGMEQAKDLCQRITLSLMNENSVNDDMGGNRDEFYNDNDSIVNFKDVDLVVVSPLTRSLQTFEYGLKKHCIIMDENSKGGKQLPVIATPLASERVYLISDLGLPVNELKIKFPYADFTSEFDKFEEKWWFTVNSSSISSCDSVNNKDDDDELIYPFNSMESSKYVEWRPNSEGQTYACYGEPDDQFNQRMIALYEWLDSRQERNVCMVSHWGVLEYLTGMDFDNCQVKEISFEQIKCHVESKHTGKIIQ